METTRTRPIRKSVQRENVGGGDTPARVRPRQGPWRKTKRGRGIPRSRGENYVGDEGSKTGWTQRNRRKWNPGKISLRGR